MPPSALRPGVLLLATLAAPVARAEEGGGGYVLPGPYVGVGRAGGGTALSFGGELSAMAWGRSDPLLGAWLQVGRVTGGAPLTRAAVGLEVATLLGKSGGVGLEVGAARLWLDDGRRGQTLAVSPFYSAGVIVLSLRTGIPLDATARSLGFEAALVVTFKVPFIFGNPGPSYSMLR